MALAAKTEFSLFRLPENMPFEFYLMLGVVSLIGVVLWASPEARKRHWSYAIFGIAILAAVSFLVNPTSRVAGDNRGNVETGSQKGDLPIGIPSGQPSSAEPVDKSVTPKALPASVATPKAVAGACDGPQKSGLDGTFCAATMCSNSGLALTSEQKLLMDWIVLSCSLGSSCRNVRTDLVDDAIVQRILPLKFPVHTELNSRQQCLDIRERLVSQIGDRLAELSVVRENTTCSQDLEKAVVDFLSKHGISVRARLE